MNNTPIFPRKLVLDFIGVKGRLFSHDELRDNLAQALSPLFDGRACIISGHENLMTSDVHSIHTAYEGPSLDNKQLTKAITDAIEETSGDLRVSRELILSKRHEAMEDRFTIQYHPATISSTPMPA